MSDNSIDLADVKQWDIWYVNWGHDDGSSKHRPALAISISTKNAERGYVRFVKITSEDHPEIPCRLMQDPSDPQCKPTGLTKRSWIHFTEEQDITADRLLNKIGRLGPFSVAYARLILKGIAGGIDL